MQTQEGKDDDARVEYIRRVIGIEKNRTRFSPQVNVCFLRFSQTHAHTHTLTDYLPTPTPLPPPPLFLSLKSGTHEGFPIPLPRESVCSQQSKSEGGLRESEQSGSSSRQRQDPSRCAV